jgi:hypothetical protein
MVRKVPKGEVRVPQTAFCSVLKSRWPFPTEGPGTGGQDSGKSRLHERDMPDTLV